MSDGILGLPSLQLATVEPLLSSP